MGQRLLSSNCIVAKIGTSLPEGTGYTQVPDRLGPESSSSSRVKSLMEVFWIQKLSTKPPISVL